MRSGNKSSFMDVGDDELISFVSKGCFSGSYRLSQTSVSSYVLCMDVEIAFPKSKLSILGSNQNAMSIGRHFTQLNNGSGNKNSSSEKPIKRGRCPFPWRNSQDSFESFGTSLAVNLKIGLLGDSQIGKQHSLDARDGLHMADQN